jgi:hypothetical protein
MLWRSTACIWNYTPCVDCQTKRHWKESIAAYANTRVLHIHQAPGDGQDTIPEEEEDVLNAVDQSPGVSTRWLGLQRHVPHMMIWRLLREHQLYPYHLQCLQALSPADYPARVIFCRWFLQQCGMNPNFTAVVFKDEVTFTRDGIKNLHNQHVWVDINLHTTIQSSHQQRFPINIWPGIVSNCWDPTFYQTGLLDRTTSISCILHCLITWKTCH